MRVLDVCVDDAFYYAKIPMWCSTEEKRVHREFPMRLPHEAFAAEDEKKPKDFNVLSFSPEELSPMFVNHVVTRNHPGMTVPLGYFSDDVPHTKKDSFYTTYWSNALTGKRYLICSIRKTDLCKCGCKGQCTFGEVQRIIAWSFNILTTGQHPEFNHLGLPFPTEHMQWLRRSTDLAGGKRGALCEMRADLLEYVGACRFKQWSHVEHPCFCCD